MTVSSPLLPREIPTIALALTWDGARLPAQSLPAKARAFLFAKSAAQPQPAPAQLAQIFADDAVKEIRICWVPQLTGGCDVLCDPLVRQTGVASSSAMVRSCRFGGILGTVYRRMPKA